MEAENKIAIPLLPERTCDIVMKGGITSGIVYPKAVCELAKEYRFVNIGGTSAGAIAASITAAAEYNRTNNGSLNGFKILQSLPEILGEEINDNTRLFSLFQPNKSTKKIFNLLIRVLFRRKVSGKIIAAATTIIKEFPILMILSLIPGAVVIYLTLQNTHNLVLLLAGLISGILLLIFTFIFFIIARVLPLFIKTLSKNSFGLTTGYLKNGGDEKSKPLTEWLSDIIDKAAGLDDGTPLTFGHLSEIKDGKKIELKMVTTNLTWGRPLTHPFSDSNSDNLFYYDEEELKEFFPDKIIKWMRDHSGGMKDGKLIFPDSQYLPVVVAARMSLSFPILISAVPLYAVDYTLKEASGQDLPLEKCLFSDGGICSNFPVHFFDSPLPRRPTFALNLNPFHPRFPQSDDESKNVHMVKNNGAGRAEYWTRINHSIAKFFGSILDTMQNWSDNTQARVPGYRDRIAHIHLNKLEGGMNLNMDPIIINKLSERGRFAGKLIASRFAGGDDVLMNWNNHRWVRFRTSLSLLEEYIEGMERAFKIPTSKIEKGYPELYERDDKASPNSYRFTLTQKEKAIVCIKSLRELIKEFEERETFCNGTPNPIPELRIKPKV